MKRLDLDPKELPSNKTFGVFWCIVTSLAASILWFLGSKILALFFLIAAVVLVYVSVRNPSALAPMNIAWMKLGLALSLITNPMIMLLLYCGMMVPVGLFMRIVGRDELSIRTGPKPSYWVERPVKQIDAKAFERQY